MAKELIIIGAGPGGYETAIEAAHRGFSVTLFNGGRLGGTCLNEGCIPTKCLCRDAEIIAMFKEADRFGIDEFTFGVDFNKIQERKNGVVEQLRGGVTTMLKQAGVTVVDAMARFKDNHTVIADGIEYSADNIIIATGSDSRSLNIPGEDLPGVMHSREILEIDYIPQSLTIIGGGVIGMEFASIFRNLGSEVTVIEYMKHILPPFDSDIAKRLKQVLSKRDIKIITGAAVKSIGRDDDILEVRYESKGKEESVSATDVLMAVGRAPRVADLGLESAGVEFSVRGIPVNDDMRTNVNNIYAIGDVNARMMLAHVATFQGLRTLNAIEQKEDKIRFDIVPSAVFTLPECGMVGLTEDKCLELGMDIAVGKSFYRANGKALAMGESDGYCKLIFDRKSALLVGAHIMGAEAADLTQQCADMMTRDATLDDIKQTIFGHPTLSEIILQACHNTAL